MDTINLSQLIREHRPIWSSSTVDGWIERTLLSIITRARQEKGLAEKGWLYKGDRNVPSPPDIMIDVDLKVNGVPVSFRILVESLFEEMDRSLKSAVENLVEEKMGPSMDQVQAKLESVGDEISRLSDKVSQGYEQALDKLLKKLGVKEGED